MYSNFAGKACQGEYFSFKHERTQFLESTASNNTKKARYCIPIQSISMDRLDEYDNFHPAFKFDLGNFVYVLCDNSSTLLFSTSLALHQEKKKKTIEPSLLLCSTLNNAIDQMNSICTVLS